MPGYGTIKIKCADREEIHSLSFGKRSAFTDTLWYLRNQRKDVAIIDQFWGYALFNDQTPAIEAIEAFAPKQTKAFGINEANDIANDTAGHLINEVHLMRTRQAR